MTYNAAVNSYGCWSLAIATLREIAVRRGRVQPRNADEQRWSAEGPRPNDQLDTVRMTA